MPRRTDFYESTRAVGILYREIEIDKQGPPLSKSPVNKQEDSISCALKPIIVRNIRGNSNYMSEIKSAFDTYADELRYICVTHTLSNLPGVRLKEEEIVVGSILAQCSQRRWRRERIYRMRLHASDLVRNVKAKLFPQMEDGVSTEVVRTVLAKAWQAWRFTMDSLASPHMQTTVGLNSFGLIALNVIFDALERLQLL